MKIGILGYGNLGKGVECNLLMQPDMELVGIFTRRDPSTVKTQTNAPVYTIDALYTMKDAIDVLIICGGSAKDLPEQTPEFASYFNVVDSFDTHAKIPEHFDRVNEASLASKHVSIISVGWDPGLFSINRLYGQAILPQGKDYTFWGKGVSQGHSDAIRRIDGVKDARQYTIPVEATLVRARNGEQVDFSAREKHTRECFVVCEKDADLESIERQIKTMPNYFADYDTTVHFITEEEMKANHANLPHGGIVLRTGKTGLNQEHTQVMEYQLTLDSNPEFTSSVLLAYARACYRMAARGQYGCKSVFDVAPIDLHPGSAEELRKTIL